MKDRVIALAGLMQALHQVQGMANNGHFETQPLSVCMDSLFRFDAETPEEIFGSVTHLKSGLQQFSKQLEGQTRDGAIIKMAMSVLQLERQYIRNPDAIRAVQHQLKHLSPLRTELGSTNADVLGKCGEIYANHISPLGSKVIVQGSPAYLSQPIVVAEIRATLLAAIRAAVLWRQMGGSYWDFVFSRGKMTKTAKELLTA
ncbi:MAG: high frequency lysogenization protein HflD [Arenimonas sp.]